MTDEVRKWIEQENLIQAGDYVLAGVSGGADSMCLLLLLLEFQKSMDFLFAVVHVEHGIRGKESRADARYVQNFCQERGVKCQVYHVDVPAYAKEHGMGMEEAARFLRYDCYRKAAEESGRHKVKIALAHHADDNAETVLFQMARGSGLKGMCGIRAKRVLGERVTVIRPLLGVTRSEIEAYLGERGQTFCIDSTNQDMDYSRNRIRHAVLPELRQVNRQAVAHISQSAAMLQELSEYLESEVRKLLGELCEKKDDVVCIRKELFEQYPVILQKEAVYHILGEVAGSRKDLGSSHVEAVIGLFGLQVGRRISLPYQMLAERSYEGIRIYRKKQCKMDDCEAYDINRQMLEQAQSAEGVSIPVADGVLRLRVLDFCGEMREIPKKTYTKWLNYDKIKYSLQFRKRAGGDYLMIDDAGHKKKLKEYFIAEKIPKEERDATWLLAMESHVLWVVGGRISADCKILANTKKILEVQMIGGKYNED